MSRLRSLVLGLLGAIAAFGAAPPAFADFVIVPVAADTAPYSFLPSLARGSSGTLYAFRTFDENSTPHDFETYLRFDVDRSDLPEGHVLVEATLVVTYAFDFTGFGDTSDLPGTLECREVLEPWTEATLTWANRPDVDAPFDTITDITRFGALLCDATPVVLDWINGLTPNDGIALTSPTPRVMGLYGRESGASASSKPQLILRTELPEPGIAVALGAGATVVAAYGRRRGRSSRADRAARPEQARAGA